MEFIIYKVFPTEYDPIIASVEYKGSFYEEEGFSEWTKEDSQRHKEMEHPRCCSYILTKPPYGRWHTKL